MLLNMWVASIIEINYYWILINVGLCCYKKLSNNDAISNFAHTKNRMLRLEHCDFLKIFLVF